MNIRILVLVVCLAGGALTAGLADRAFAAKAGLISDAEALAKFAAATAAYKLENYDQAIAAYEEILREGKESGALYYNLGNSYFKKGKLGKVILNYERARRLIPRDGDLNFNLEYARQLVEPRIRNFPGKVGSDVPLSAEVGVPTAMQLSVGIEQRIRNWTDREIVWALTGLALTGALLHLLSLFGQWPPPWRRWAIGLVCVLWLICFGGFVTKLAAEEDLAFVITSSEAKFEPREEATIHFTLGEGTTVKVLEVEDIWAKVKRPDGKVGWVPEKVFERF